ncbi:MAG: hypothetical protein N2Z59_03615 [Alteraurantiacibacter sp.]|nr:hypothetical protein [Alteraurantiacibacter sp.]
MSDEIATMRPIEEIEALLRARLAAGDLVLASIQPILQHLLASRDSDHFSDEVIARVRGMIGHVARQMLVARAQQAQYPDPGQFADRHEGELATLLAGDVAMLMHAHALAVEALVATRLQTRSNLDPVLSPLLQEMAASSDESTAAAAMHAIAAQARFMQTQRRMELPLGELPGELLHKALLAMRAHAGDDPVAARAEEALRAGYDESSGRLGQLTRLVVSLGSRAQRALVLSHAGLAMFTTAYSMASGQDRNAAILTYGEGQLTRFALALRAAGLSQEAVEEQVNFLHPDLVLPPGFDRVTPQAAARLLTRAEQGPLTGR